MSSGSSAPSISAGAFRRGGEVRALTPADLDGVVALHRACFGTEHPEEATRRFLRSVFFEHPWLDDSMTSLGHFTANGSLIGTLGVMPRPMKLDGKPVRAVVTHNFMVHPDHRRGLTAINLMRTMFEDGGPDLVMAEGTEQARRIWEALGGRVLASRSTRWLRVLRPAAFLAHAGVEGHVSPTLARWLQGLAVLPDAVASLVIGSFARAPSPCNGDLVLNESELARLIDQDAGDFSLKPVYQEASLRWLMSTLSQTHRDQHLRGCTVPGSVGHSGWYVYYSRPNGIGRVLQLGGDASMRQEVLEHLFADAYHEGNVGVSGQGDPAWSGALRACSCFVRPGASWFLSHSADEDIQRVLDTPHAFLSRLEGEGWLRFAC